MRPPRSVGPCKEPSWCSERHGTKLVVLTVGFNSHPLLQKKHIKMLIIGNKHTHCISVISCCQKTACPEWLLGDNLHNKSHYGGQSGQRHRMFLRLWASESSCARLSLFQTCQCVVVAYEKLCNLVCLCAQNSNFMWCGIVAWLSQFQYPRMTENVALFFVDCLNRSL